MSLEETMWPDDFGHFGNSHSGVKPFRCLVSMPPEGRTRAGILPDCPSLDRVSREAEVGFEPWTFRSVTPRYNHVPQLRHSTHQSQASPGDREEKVSGRKRREASAVACLRLPALLYATSKATRLMAPRDGRCGMSLLLDVGIMVVRGLGYCPHLDRRTIRVLNQSLWLKSLIARQQCLAGNANALPFLWNKPPHVPTPNLEDQETVFVRPLTIDQPGMSFCEWGCTGDTPSTAQWVAEVHKPSHHGKVQSLRSNSGRFPKLNC
ncbi:hypothetical protein CSKR_104780 [Clonorchis sinensis]|uniref:Uncharacterized protein n=1 Tax=Clonorchis sinensis TaxID=79923 RepID=A0A3R7CVI7_CLOSI|nr:hypothetical protein CSKR_104780 [Clonorchis sinensis]